MAAVEFEIGCAVCRKPVAPVAGALVCPTHGALPAELLRQTGARRRKQFESWRRSHVVPFPLKPVAFR